MNQTKLEKNALALLKIGVNIQKGETLVLQTSTEALELAREVTKQAFKLGAKDVIVHLEDAEIEHLRALNCTSETLEEVPNWRKDALEHYFAQGKAVQMGIHVSTPSLNDDVDSKNLLAQAYAKNEVRNVVRKYLHKGELRWVGTAHAGMNWANTLYPELSDADAFIKLDNQICDMLRVDDDTDVVENWEKHIKTLGEVSDKLNSYNFKSLHISTELGTDLTMDLVKDHIWTSAGSMGSSKIAERYVANMPTEEVFTDPDYRTVNGTVYAALPLMMSGKLVTDFSITFENGRAIDCSASNNADLLKDALFKTERTRYLGEVALVSKHSPIKKMEQIFLNGLIDENAACHLAFGSSFPSSVKNGAHMSEEELLSIGVNVATSHNDFMFGTEETKIVGTTFDGAEVIIMEHGEFAI